MIKKFLLCIIIFIPTAIFAEIRENELSNYRAAFLKKILASNPGRETEIKKCMNGYIKNAASGIRLIDKFALF